MKASAWLCHVSDCPMCPHLSPQCAPHHSAPDSLITPAAPASRTGTSSSSSSATWCAWIIFLNWVAFLLGKILLCFNNVLRLNCWLMILITLNFPESELHYSMLRRNYYRGILFITTRMVGWYNIQEDYNAFEKIKRSLPSFRCNLKDVIVKCWKQKDQENIKCTDSSWQRK